MKSLPRNLKCLPSLKKTQVSNIASASSGNESVLLNVGFALSRRGAIGCTDERNSDTLDCLVPPSWKGMCNTSYL
jgi:hypothetical protein